MKRFRENWKIGIALMIVMLITAMPISEVYAQEILSPEERREQEMEEIGEDIIINVDEYQPKIVRASLLEEQGVNIHALLTGIPSNPTITIPNIQSVSVRPVKITTKPENLKDKVKIGNIRYYAPGRKELFSGYGLEMQGYRQDASFNNLGYLRIPIKRIPKEDDVPEEITIEMDGFVYYYVSEGLGFTQTEMVLNEMSESEWMKQREQNSFFGGYLRADKINKDSVDFILYDNSGVPVDRKISVSRGSTSKRLDSYGFFRRLFGNDYSSKKNLFSKFKIRVDEIRGRGATAELLVFKNGEFMHRVLKEGDALYPGSWWYVESIRERAGTNDDKSEDKKTNYENFRIKEVKLKSKGFFGLDSERVLKLIVAQQKQESMSGEETKEEGSGVSVYSCSVVVDLSKVGEFKNKITELEECVKKSNDKNYAFSELNKIKLKYYSLLLGSAEGSDSYNRYKAGIDRLDKIINENLPEGKKGITTSTQSNVITTAEEAYENAVTAFNKIVVNYPDAKKDENNLWAAEAQREIVKIYVDLIPNDPSYQGLAIQAIDDLLNNYDNVPNAELLKKLSDSLKRTSFAYNTEQASASLQEESGSDSVSLISVDVARGGSSVSLEVDGKIYNKELEESLGEIGLDNWYINEIDDNYIKIDKLQVGIVEAVEEKVPFVSVQEKLLLGVEKQIKFEVEEEKDGKKEKIEVLKKIVVKDIDLKREVKVTLIPEIERAYSRAHFNLHIPVEKRPFKLPLFSDSIDEEINKTQKLIDKTEKLIGKLEKLHNYWSKFCLVTFASLTVKNFFFGAKNAAARKEIGGLWRDKYDKRKDNENDLSYDNFIIKYRIDYTKDLEGANSMIREGQGKSDFDKYHFYAQKRAELWGDANPTYIHDYVVAELDKIENDVDNDIKKITKDELETWAKGKNLYNSHVSSEEYKISYRGDKLNTKYREFFNGVDKRVSSGDALDDWERFLGDNNIKVSERSKIANLGLTKFKSTYLGEESEGEVIQEYMIGNNGEDDGKYIYNGKKIFVDEGVTSLTNANYQEKITGTLYVTGTNGGYKKITINEAVGKRKADMQPRLSLVEGGRQENLVEMISISAYTYAQVEYTSGGAVKSVDIYARAKPNDNLGTGYSLGSIGDPVLDRQLAAEGLQEDIAAVNRIRAQIINCNREITQSGFGKRREVGADINCAGSNFKITNAKSPIITTSCTDVMSPIDCGIMFNACDPVMCPASRCNLGGNWELGPGESVAETGIIGSVALCLPNAGVPPEGVIMPVCLTGILAGLKNIQSMLVGYKECLKVSRDEGKSVGICDKVRNVAICDILWREALAIFGVKGGLLNFVFGKLGANEGGEYFILGNMQENLENTRGALEYFTQDYAKNVFAKYSGGSLKEIGGEICKAAVYGKGPGVGDFFDQIQKPESPPQFFAVVDEIPMTDITTTPRSMYNVYYHMYAGENEDIRYSVYLKQEDPFTGQSGIIYVLSEGRQISSVNLGAGESEDISADFEASSGYDQVCVRIASTTYGIREECGFGKATSSFAINRLSDGYTANQAQREIKTEEQCTPSAGRITELSTQDRSLSGINPLSATIGAFSSGLTQTGIIRKCSYYNPGVGDDENKWAPVGTCGEDERGRELGRCWLYQENIQNLIRDKELEKAVQKGLKTVEDELREKGIIEKGVTVAGGINVIAEVKKGLDSATDPSSFRSWISELEKVISEVYDAKGDEDLVVKAKAQFTIGLVYKKWGGELREKEKKELEEKPPEKETPEKKLEESGREATRTPEARIFNLPSEPAIINVDYEWLLAVSYNYDRSDQIWKYKFGGLWWSVEGLVGGDWVYSKEHEEIANYLKDFDELRGYTFFDKLSKGIIKFGDAELEDVIGLDALTEVKKAEPVVGSERTVVEECEIEKIYWATDSNGRNEYLDNSELDGNEIYLVLYGAGNCYWENLFDVKVYKRNNDGSFTFLITRIDAIKTTNNFYFRRFYIENSEFPYQFKLVIQDKKAKKEQTLYKKVYKKM